MKKTFTTALTGEEMPPLGGWRHHLARGEACHWIRGSRGSPMNPVPLPPPLAGEVRRSRIGGGERSEPIRRILIIPYGTESKSRNADFILIAREGDTTTL